MGIQLVNTFSMDMLDLDSGACTVQVTPLPETVVKYMEFDSRLSDRVVAQMLSTTLTRPLEPNRIAIKLRRGDTCIQARLMNKTGLPIGDLKALSPVEVDKLRQDIDYSFMFYLIEVK